MSIPKTPRDHALALFKAGVAAVPVVGGSIASLLADYVPMATERSAQYASERLAERLRVLKDRIDVDAVDRDEFSELFKSAYLLVQRSHHKRKLNAAVALFTNLLLRRGDPAKLSYTELDHFARCLDLLSIGAIDVLYGVGEVYERARDAGPDFLQRFRPSFSALSQRFPNHDPDLLMGLVAELAALNLLRLPGVPGIATPNYGNQTVLLTSLGLRFIARILDAIDD